MIIYVSLNSSPTAASASGISGADESSRCAPMVWRPSWPVRLRLLHHIGASPEHAAPPRTGTWGWSERSSAVVPHPPTPGGGWRRAGRCSQLLSDAKHPQHPRNGFWLGVSWAKSVEFSKVKYKFWIDIHHTWPYTTRVRNSCPGAA
jgi:hypothetical protein